MPQLKPRKKRDGTYELPYPCPFCGPDACQVNSQSLWANCFKCPWKGKIKAEEVSHLDLSLFENKQDRTPREFSPLPAYALNAVGRRFDPLWLTKRYRVMWDGERLWWPAGYGGSRRAVWDWQEPKTITTPPRNIIGQHLMVRGAHLVITEGDYKAAAIPLPWVGIGLMGVSITDTQALLIRASQPSSVTVLLDGGYDNAAREIQKSLAPLPCRVVRLPRDMGPDDVSRRELYRLLMEEK